MVVDFTWSFACGVFVCCRAAECSRRGVVPTDDGRREIICLSPHVKTVRRNTYGSVTALYLKIAEMTHRHNNNNNTVDTDNNIDRRVSGSSVINKVRCSMAFVAGCLDGNV